MVRLALSGVLFGAAAGAIAQTSAGNTPEIQEVLVTGSNILRAENDGTIPVSVIGEEAMEVRGALLPVDLLTSLPSVVNLPENETRLGSSGARGDNANINLRNMGATATIIHFNAGWVEGDRLVVSHSNYPQMPFAASLEIHDRRTLQPVESHSFGMQLGNLNWVVRHQGYWWACYANYSNQGAVPGFDQSTTHVIQYNDNWQQLQSWLFPPQVVAAWGDSSCSGGDFGEDGLLYVTGHDEPELYVLRLPKQGVTLEYVTTIDVPFEGQAWAWDRSLQGERVIYGISRAQQQIIAARIPDVPVALL